MPLQQQPASALSQSQGGAESRSPLCPRCAQPGKPIHTAGPHLGKPLTNWGHLLLLWLGRNRRGGLCLLTCQGHRL